jgi:hypothetical protein
MTGARRRAFGWRNGRAADAVPSAKLLDGWISAVGDTI